MTPASTQPGRVKAVAVALALRVEVGSGAVVTAAWLEWGAEQEVEPTCGSCPRLEQGHSWGKSHNLEEVGGGHQVAGEQRQHGKRGEQRKQRESAGWGAVAEASALTPSPSQG